MAGGNAVCGSSAIGAIAPAIQADDEEKRADHHTRQFVRNSDDVDFAVSWSGVVWFGCFTKSALLGGTLQSVGQVVAGASLLDAEIVKYAMLFKIARIILLVVVVLIFERMVSQQKSIRIRRKTKTIVAYSLVCFRFFADLYLEQLCCIAKLVE